MHEDVGVDETQRAFAASSQLSAIGVYRRSSAADMVFRE
jgi:hypothetical protein